MTRILAAFTGVVLVAVGALLWMSREQAVQPAAEVVADKGRGAPAGETASRPAAIDAAGRDQPRPSPRPERASEAAIRVNPEVVASMRHGRLEGDERSPPLAENRPERERPSAEALADPDMYLEYEKQQKQKIYVSFLRASSKKVTELEAAIADAEARGLAAEQLEEGREKLRRLRAMREKLLRDHPSLADSAAGAGSPESGADNGQDEPAP